MKKKRSWNNTNPLFRYLQSKKSKSRRVKTSGVKTMARRKKTYRRSGISNSGLLMTVGAAMLYGAARSKISSITSQYIPNIAGQYTDEVVLGVAGWYLSKKGGILGQVGKSALIIESASVGNQLTSGMTTSSSSNTYVYN